MGYLVKDWHFDRADYLAPGRADDFLRFHISDFMGGVQETGHVESPIGHVTMVEVTRDDIAKWVSSEGDPWMSEARNFAPGWYLVQTTNAGFVHGHHYATQAEAEADFEEADRHFEVWAGGQGL